MPEYLSGTPEKGLPFRKVEGGYIIVLPRGLYAMKSLLMFVERHKIQAGTIQAIGALEEVTLGYFLRDQGRYAERSFSGVFELISFIGNISLIDEKPFIHAHAVLGDRKFQTIGGHFFEGMVAVTMEVFLAPFSGAIRRRFDVEANLNFLDLE